MDWIADLTAGIAALWGLVLLLPWQPWRNREILHPQEEERCRVETLTVLIPARNEADVIRATLSALARQAPGVRVVLVDDCSEDGTAAAARQVPDIDLILVPGQPPPPGWSGKLWALEQGLRHVETPEVLLLDADIVLQPGMLAALQTKLVAGYDLVSIMALLRTRSFWEKLLMPAFVYFFKFIYPFALSNHPRIGWVAAAAGGCILTKTEWLHRCGAFASLKEALIDDCTLATRIKALGGRTWIGLSRGVVSQRAYIRLPAVWEMVARTAFTQLNYSPLYLGICTCLMVLMFWLPWAALLWPESRIWGVLAWFEMSLSYLPMIRFYHLHWIWSLLLPPIASLYLGMTWDSALRYWRGERSRWKGRTYEV